MTNGPADDSSPAECVRWLSAAEYTVATAESLTAGLISASLAAVPGASAALLGGVVTYATEAKATVLGVPQQLIDEHGVVSEQCAGAMALSVRDVFAATWGVSATGVAGPNRQEGHPVGTVYVGVAGPEGVRVRALNLSGSREEIRTGSVGGALRLLLAALGKEPAAGTPRQARLEG